MSDVGLSLSSITFIFIMEKEVKNIILACLLLVSCNVYAGSGKAIIPHWLSDTISQHSAFYISNITGHDLQVQVTFYKEDGTAISPTLYTDFAAANTEIPARSSAHVVMQYASGHAYGYAVIEWQNKSTDDDTVGLVAGGYRTVGTTRIYSIPVNNGVPF